VFSLAHQLPVLVPFLRDRKSYFTRSGDTCRARFIFLSLLLFVTPSFFPLFKSPFPPTFPHAPLLKIFAFVLTICVQLICPPTWWMRFQFAMTWFRQSTRKTAAFFGLQFCITFLPPFLLQPLLFLFFSPLKAL